MPSFIIVLNFPKNGTKTSAVLCKFLNCVLCILNNTWHFWKEVPFYCVFNVANIHKVAGGSCARSTVNIKIPLISRCYCRTSADPPTQLCALVRNVTFVLVCKHAVWNTCMFFFLYWRLCHRHSMQVDWCLPVLKYSCFEELLIPTILFMICGDYHIQRQHIHMTTPSTKDTLKNAVM